MVNIIIHQQIYNKLQRRRQDFMKTRKHSLNICQVSFSHSKHRKKDKTVLVGREEIAFEELGRTSPCRMQKGNIFIPTVSIRPQTRCLQPKRNSAKPILPATLNYSKFPQRKMINSFLRMSTPSTKNKTFNLDSFDPRSTISRQSVSMKTSTEKSNNHLRNCTIAGSRERLLRYSQISEARIYRKAKTIGPLQSIDS